MNLDTLRLYAEAAPWRLLGHLTALAKHPTERNACFISGYVAALQDQRLLDFDQAKFWRSAVDAVASGALNLSTLRQHLPPVA